MAAPQESELTTKLEMAFDQFLRFYAKWGGHNYYGWDDYADPRNYRGPVLWTEGDCVFRLAERLEKEFPYQVHTEMPVARWTFHDYDETVDKRQFVDVVVSDLREFVEDDTSQARFRVHMHDIFIEAKYFPAGCSKTWRYDHVRKVKAVWDDAERLKRHLERSHCRVTAVFVVDDDGLFEDESGKFDWPEKVLRLVASPQELERRRKATTGS